MRDATLSMAAVAIAGISIVLGSFGAWGVIDLVPEQAAIVASTRWLLAGLGMAASILSLATRRSPVAQAIASALFIAAGALAYGEYRYEENQQFQYGLTASRWGLFALLSGSAVGAAACLLRALTHRKRSASTSAR